MPQLIRPLITSLRHLIASSTNTVAPVAFTGIALASASFAVFSPVTEASANTGIAVFVGYADNLRAFPEFPNPWAASPNVTFDGCAPIADCSFDAGAIRVANVTSSPAVVDAITVHIASCTYSWSGPRYPVTLAAGASLVITQRGSGAAPGCTGPDPTSFDSSDIPSMIGCTNNGILPVVDVTVDGVTTSLVDSGQVLNTGGFDSEHCFISNESTQWVPIGSKPCPGQSLTLTPAAQTHTVLSVATVTATFTNACGSPLSGVLVAFDASAGPNAGRTGSGVTDANGAVDFSYSSSLEGTDTLLATVTNATGFMTTSNSVSATWTVPFAPGGGSFVIGNGNAVMGSSVNFWGSQWAKKNALSGGPAPRSFKGFAESPAEPACGEQWTADPGNSTPPPDGPLPPFMGLIVTSSSRQVGSQISGDVVAIVVVRTDAGYEPNPGHAATGTVVAVECGTLPQGSSVSPPPVTTTGNGRSGGKAAGVSAGQPVGGAPSAAPEDCAGGGRSSGHGGANNQKRPCPPGQAAKH